MKVLSLEGGPPRSQHHAHHSSLGIPVPEKSPTFLRLVRCTDPYLSAVGGRITRKLDTGLPMSICRQEIIRFHAVYCQHF